MQFETGQLSQVKNPQYQINLTTQRAESAEDEQKLRTNSSSDSKRSDAESFMHKGSKTFGYLAQKTAEGLKNIVPSLLPGVGVSTEMIKKNLIEEDQSDDEQLLLQPPIVSDKPDFTIKFNCD